VRNMGDRFMRDRFMGRRSYPPPDEAEAWRAIPRTMRHPRPLQYIRGLLIMSDMLYRSVRNIATSRGILKEILARRALSTVDIMERRLLYVAGRSTRYGQPDPVIEALRRLNSLRNRLSTFNPQADTRAIEQDASAVKIAVVEIAKQFMPDLVAPISFPMSFEHGIYTIMSSEEERRWWTVDEIVREWERRWGRTTNLTQRIRRALERMYEREIVDKTRAPVRIRGRRVERVQYKLRSGASARVFEPMDIGWEDSGGEIG